MTATLSADKEETSQHVDNTTEDPASKFIEWLKEEWLMKLGAFLILIAFGWFVSYAIANNWIGPVGRITAGMIAGIGIMVLGYWRISGRRHQGEIFMVLGSASVLLTIFAAREFYDFFTPLSALAVMFISVIFVAGTSVVYRSLPLALSGLILAGLAPQFLGAALTVMLPEILTYLLIVVLGTLWVVALTGWRQLTFASLILIALYSFPYFFSHLDAGEKFVGLVFAIIFSIVFFLATTFAIIKTKEQDDNLTADVVTAGGSGLYLLAWIMLVVSAEWQSIMLLGAALIFGVGSFLVFSATRIATPFYIYIGIAAVFIGAATAAELDGPALTIAYTIEAASAAILAYIITRNMRIAEHMSVLMVIPAFLSLPSFISREWVSGVLHQDFAVLGVVMAAFFVLGFFFLTVRKETGESGDTDHNASRALLFVGSVYALALVWLISHALLLETVATTMSLTLYTITGLMLYFKGIRDENNELRILGGILLVAVVVRLLTIDVWDMELLGRVVTFALVGVLLLSTAFFKRKRTDDSVLLD